MKSFPVVAFVLALLQAACGSTVTTVQPEAKPATEVKAPEPKGVLAGRLYRKDNKAPVGEQYLSFQGGETYRSAYTDGYGRFRVEALPEGEYTLSFYDEGYKTTEFGPYRVGKDEVVTGLEVALEPVDPQVTPYTYQDVYRPGENVEVVVRSIRVTELDIDLYHVPEGFVRERLSGAINRRALDLSALESILSYKQPVSGGGALRWRSTPVQPAFDKPGVYVVRVRGGSSDVAMPLLVTNLALITKRGPGGVMAFATDLTTGAPQPFVQVVAEGRADLGTTATGQDGIVELQTGKQGGNLRLWGFAGPNVAYVDTVPPAAVTVAPYRAYIITDRPIYRTGHDVFYKVVARSDEGGSYRVRPGEQWQVVLQDALGRQIVRQEKVTGPFGTFSGQFSIDEEGALGEYAILVSRGPVEAAESLQVQEYRKPDFELQVRADASQVVQGEDVRLTVQGRYYFGAPLADAEVSYTVYETPYFPWRDSSWGDASAEAVYDDEDRYGETYGYGRALTSGSVKLDAEGKGIVELAVPPATYDRKVTVEVSAVDSSDREVSARQSLVVSAGTFGLAINADGYIFKVGEDIGLDVVTRQFDGSPVASRVKVTASVETYNDKYKLWVYKVVDTRSVETGAAGKKGYALKAAKPGVLRIDAVSTDAQGNSVTDTRYLWITTAEGVGGWQKKKSMEVVIDKTSYVPGETAKVLVNSQVPDANVLFTVEDALGVRHAEVVKLKGNSRYFEVKLKDADAPTLYLSAVFTQNKSFYQATRALAISPESRMLKVKLTTDKEIYAPGEEATVTALATDAQGAPAVAELALAMVDEAIYALASDNIVPIGQFFYGPRSSVVTTSYSYPSRYLGGASKDGGDGVRRDFKDTAYWNASVVTDAAGRAVVKVKMPDNLTSWRLVARAATGDEGGTPLRVGQGTAKVTTAKDLIARLLPPRFAMVGDRFELVGQVHNLGEDASAVKVWLEVEGPIEIEGAAETTLSLTSGQQAPVRWPVRVTGPGSPLLRMYARSPSHSDAMELGLPVHPVSVPRTLAVSGLTHHDGSATFVVPEGAVPGTARLRLEVTPSLGGLALESLDSLARFPYGCVEQTMSAFLPDVVLQLALSDLGQVNERLEAKLPVMIAKGVSRLQRLQHDDGGWGWWENDATHPFMTAYVVYGLMMAERGGFDVGDGLVDSGLAALREQALAAEGTANFPYMLYALSLCADDEDRVRSDVAKLVADPPRIATYNLAVLALAAAQVKDEATAKVLVAELGKRVQREGTAAWFKGTSYHYGWTENRFETTAMALRAIVSVDPKDPLIPQVTEWLVRHRRGGLWDTTRDSAAAVHALVDVLRETGEARATFDAKVSIDGKLLATLKVTPEVALSTRESVVLGPEDLAAGEHSIEVDLEGPGTIYWSGALQVGDAPEPRANGFAVSRTYRRVVRSAREDGTPIETLVDIDKGGIDVGDEIEIQLSLESPDEQEYLIVEDPLVPGFAVRPHSLGASSDDGWSFWYSHFEVRDEKVAFFATKVGKGKHTLSYRARAETSGTLTAAPAVAWQMYMPEIAGNSAKSTLTVAPRK